MQDMLAILLHCGVFWRKRGKHDTDDGDDEEEDDDDNE